MRYALIQVAVLVAVVVITAAAAYQPVTGRWGDAGREALWAAVAICLGAALLAAVPLGLAMRYYRSAAAQIALAGTAVRLLATGALAIAYQVLVDVELMAFLICLVLVYSALLVAETVLAVVLVRRVLGGPAARHE